MGVETRSQMTLPVKGYDHKSEGRLLHSVHFKIGYEGFVSKIARALTGRSRVALGDPRLLLATPLSL